MSRTRIQVVLAGVLMALGLVLASPHHAFAHATLGSTDPPANEIVSRSPGRVDLRFTEPVEETYTKVVLIDESGAEVAGTSFALDSADETVGRLTIPDELERGTYSVVWRTLSAADGHRFSGYFAFTIGSSANVSTVIPPTFATTAGPPFWLNGLSRWFSFLGLSLLTGIWFAWLFVVRPGLSPVWQIGPQVGRRVKRYAIAAGITYLAATLVALVVQVSGQADGNWSGALADTLTDTRWGRLWIVRVALGSLITLAFLAAAWWWPRRRTAMTAVLLALSALLPLPHALISHASAQQHGRTVAIAVDYYHLAAMSVWLGGLALLLVTHISASSLLPDGQRAFLVRTLPRFSFVALASLAVLGLTGFYSGFLQIGTWEGLFDTRYGRQLIYKLIALIVVLVLAAINLLVVSRRIGGAPSESVPGWWKRFAGLVALEIAGVVLVLVFSGRLTGLEPARSVLAERGNQQEIAFDLNGRPSTLSIAPGSSGPNHFRLDVGGEALEQNVTAALLLVPPQDMAGQKSIVLERALGNGFEAHSAEMSVVGDWAMTVTVSRVGAFQWSSDVVFAAGERTPADSSIALPSWTFTANALAGFVLGLLGLGAVVSGWRSTRRSSRREGFGLGAVALVIGIVLVWQGRADVISAGIPLDTPNPVPVTQQAVEVGKSSFQANCIACHGVGAAGDGPLADTMSPPPANLLDGHAIYHFDAEFFNWISQGKPGTDMPPFAQSLTEEQIWSTILYIRSLQDEYAVDRGVPAAQPTPGGTPIP